MQQKEILNMLLIFTKKKVSTYAITVSSLNRVKERMKKEKRNITIAALYCGFTFPLKHDIILFSTDKDYPPTHSFAVSKESFEKDTMMYCLSSLNLGVQLSL